MGVTFRFTDMRNEGLGAAENVLHELIHEKRIPQPDIWDDAPGAGYECMDFTYNDIMTAARIVRNFIKHEIVFSVSYQDAPKKADD